MSLFSESTSNQLGLKNHSVRNGSIHPGLKEDHPLRRYFTLNSFFLMLSMSFVQLTIFSQVLNSYNDSAAVLFEERGGLKAPE